MNFRNIFKELIKHLEFRGVRYCILRGYEGLPDAYTNDIDFAIHSSDSKQLFDALQDIKTNLKINIDYRDSRFEMLKTTFKAQKRSIDIDFWFGFNYVGLRYVDIDNLINKSIKYRNFEVASAEYEVTVSFLKELLHMNRLRTDKVDILTAKLSTSEPTIFSDYFDNKWSERFINVILNRRFQLKTLSCHTKVNLICTNIKRHGLFSTFRNIVKFILYRIDSNANPIRKNFNTI